MTAETKLRLLAAAVLIGCGFVAGWSLRGKLARPAAPGAVQIVQPTPSPAAQPGVTPAVKQIIHAIPIVKREEPKPEKCAPEVTAGGMLVYDLPGYKLEIDPAAPAESTITKRPRTFAAYIDIETNRDVKAKLISASLYIIPAGAAPDSPITWDPEQDVTWNVAVGPAPGKTGGRFLTVEQNVGFGASFGGWGDVDPCVTYSFLRAGRMRLPSAFADTQGNLGAGVQLRIWRPFHVGAFAAWDFTDEYSRSVRVTATLNL